MFVINISIYQVRYIWQDGFTKIMFHGKLALHKSQEERNVTALRNVSQLLFIIIIYIKCLATIFII